MKNITNKTAIRFVLLLGLVSLFADVTYEGARSITGPYLATLGSTATIIGLVAGFGEMIGYVLRLLSGYLTDRIPRYWFIVIIGYLVNLLAVPLLAFTTHLPLAAALIILERAGKGLRTPPRDVMLSYTASRIGAGFGFGLHEAMDKLGGMVGPIIVSVILLRHGSYQHAFAFLFIPALLALITLFIAWRVYPEPQILEKPTTRIQKAKLDKTFWLYLAGVSCIAAGYADFALMAYHFEKSAIFVKAWIPVSYAIALGASALSSLLFGALYDRMGFILLILTTLISVIYAPLVFFGNSWVAMIGIVLWGVGIGVQSTVMRAVVAKMIATQKRGIAYGVFNTVFGVFWFLGSALMGILYDFHLMTLVVFSVVMQLLAIPLFLLVRP